MSTRKLEPSLTWLEATIVILGAFSVTIFSAGAALSEIGGWSLAVWAAVTAVGLLQAYILYELAKQFPHKAGGTATYANELFGKNGGESRILAFLSGWGYWIAWTPAVAVNSYLSANLINQVLGLTLNPILLALVVVGFLYTVNYFGVAKVVFSSYALAVLHFIALVTLTCLAFQVVTLDRLAEIFSFSETPSWPVLLKWFFVIAWTGYAVEMISCVIAETLDHEKNTRRMFGIASIASVIAFVGVPLLLALLTDWNTLAQDPFQSLQPLFVEHLGELGARLLSLDLLGALFYSSISFIISSTRTIYQMSHDGLLPAFFGTVNQYGSPKGSLVLDLALNIGLLVLFQSKLIELLAVANVGYLVVFVILPVAFLRFLVWHKGDVSLVQCVLIAFLWAVNVVALFIGGYAWGGFVFGVGWLLVLLGIPLYFAASNKEAPVPETQTPQTAGSTVYYGSTTPE